MLLLYISRKHRATKLDLVIVKLSNRILLKLTNVNMFKFENTLNHISLELRRMYVHMQLVVLYHKHT